MLFDIENTVGSISNQIDFSFESQRLIYKKNSEIVHIIPPLHRTAIHLFAMLPRKYQIANFEQKRQQTIVPYLAVKKYKDKFYAFDIFNTITVWDAVTGKHIA
jgi:hypothetical protein